MRQAASFLAPEVSRKRKMKEKIKKGKTLFTRIGVEPFLISLIFCTNHYFS